MATEQLGRPTKTQSVLAESFATDDVDVGYWVGLYKQTREEAGRYIQSPLVAIEKLGLDAVTGRQEEGFYDFMVDIGEELGVSEEDYRNRLKIAEYTALHQAMAFVSDPSNAEKLRQKAKRQAQILAIATGVIPEDFTEVDLDDEEMTKLLEEWSVKEGLNRKIREEFLKGKELPVLAESWLKPMEEGDVDYYVKLYRRRKEELLARTGQTLSIVINGLGLDKAVGDPKGSDRLLKEVEEGLGSRHSNTKIRAKIAEYVALHQATALSLDETKSESLRNQAKRQAQILAIVSQEIPDDFIAADINNRLLSDMLKIWATKEGLIQKARVLSEVATRKPTERNTDSLIGLPTVKWSVGELVKWLKDPENSWLKDFEAVLSSDEPVAAVKRLANSLGKKGIQRLTDVITNKAVEIKNELENPPKELADKEDRAQRLMARRFGANLEHEMKTRLSGIRGFLDMLTLLDDPTFVSKTGANALAQITEEYLLFENLRILHRFGVFDQGLAGRDHLFTPQFYIDQGSFDKTASQVLKIFKAVLGDKLEIVEEGRKEADVQEKARPLQDQDKVAKGEAYLRTALMNLMVDAIKYSNRDEKGELTDNVVVKKLEDALVIENEIHHVSEEKMQEWIRVIQESFAYPLRVFNGREIEKDSPRMSDTQRVELGVPGRQGPGDGLATARLCLAKVGVGKAGMGVEHRIRGTRVITIIHPKDFIE